MKHCIDCRKLKYRNDGIPVCDGVSMNCHDVYTSHDCDDFVDKKEKMKKNCMPKEGYHIQQDRPLSKSWEPSEKAMKLLADLYARLKSHDCREGDYYFLIEIVNEALWDKSYGPKLDRKIKAMK